LDFGVSGESFSLYSMGKKPIDLNYYYYIRGAFTIDSSTPTLRRILNEHPISIGSFHHKKDIFGRTFLKSL
jgi:hypothetical protein